MGDTSAFFISGTDLLFAMESWVVTCVGDNMIGLEANYSSLAGNIHIFKNPNNYFFQFPFYILFTYKYIAEHFFIIARTLFLYSYLYQSSLQQ